jgi:hypothetical protein
MGCKEHPLTDKRITLNTRITKVISAMDLLLKIVFQNLKKHQAKLTIGMK